MRCTRGESRSPTRDFAGSLKRVASRDATATVIELQNASLKRGFIT
jgi:hypothetical protein